jgi:hypothetical protein
MQPDQNVSDMVNEVLMRQARARAARTGERIEESLVLILETEAGSQLRMLSEGAHRDERAEDWQEDLARKRAAEREKPKAAKA